MEGPLEITYRGIDGTEALDRLVRSRVEKLERIAPHLVSCRIAIERSHNHRQTGNPLRVRLEMRLPPGHDLVVDRKSSQENVHDDPAVLFKRVYERAHRLLTGLVRKQQGQVKAHPRQETAALVDRIFPDEGYGFLRTPEGRDIYFHRNSVLGGGFDRIKPGTGVSYSLAEDDQGEHASTVQIVDKAATHKD